MFDGVFVNSRSPITIRFVLTLLLIIFLLPILGFTFRSPSSHNHIVGLLSTAENANTQASAHTNYTPPSAPPEGYNASFINTTSTTHQDTEPVVETEPSNIPTSRCNKRQPASYPLHAPEEDDLPQVLIDYIKFHKTGRVCLLDPGCQPKPKILVANCPRKLRCLGLGDRMRGVVFSFTLAILTKRLYFIHEFTPSYPLTAGLAPFAIDWTLPSTVLYNHSWPYLEWYWCHDGRPCKYNLPLLTNFPNFEDEGPDINMWEDDLVKLFEDKPVVSIASRMPRQLIKFVMKNPYLKDVYEEMIIRFREKTINVHRLLFQPSEAVKGVLKGVEFEDDYFSVHIRNGVDSEETSVKRFRYMATHEEEVMNDMLGCLKRVGEGRGIKNVFLGSDSPTMKDLFLRKGKEHGFVVHLVAERTVHFERKWGKSSDSDESLCDGFINVFVDLFMLARGRVMVKTGSTFASLAANLAGVQDVVQFRPGTDSLEQSCRALR